MTQNSGIGIDAYDHHGNKETYFGFIEELLEASKF
uniref:Uncharacterized protein n=1 Tax=Arundo donax TaxID=35708 RepID=A0A0A9CFG5_ARUDO